MFTLLIPRSLLVAAAFVGSLSTSFAQNEIWTPGVGVKLFDVQESMERLFELVPNQSPNVDVLRPDFGIGDEAFVDPITGAFFSDYYIVVAQAQIFAPTAGTYQFELESDDGSFLYFGNETVIDNDLAHGPETVSGSRLLAPGWHDLTVKAFNDVGGFTLDLRWKKPGDSGFVSIPQSSLRADSNVVRVVAPGKKFILKAGDQAPGTGLPVAGVHPAWDLETIRPAGFDPMVGAMALAGNSTLYLGTFQPNQADDPGFDSQARIWRVDNVDGDPALVTRTQVAGEGLTGTAQLNDITGLEWVAGELFVAERTGIFRLLDANSDGLYESKELIGDTWNWDNFHQFPFCLKHRSEADGEYLYGALSVAIALGGASDSNRNASSGSAFRLKIPAPGSRNDVEYLAGGFRTPNGVGFGPNGELLVADNQGDWNPANSLVHVQNGRFYGHYNPTDVFPPPSDYTAQAGLFEDQPVSPKSVQLPHNEVANSPTDILTLNDGPFAGQIIVGELTAGGTRRISLESIGGALQGAVFRHSQGFEAGVNRLRQAPDGSIYVGCMGSNGGWSFNDLTSGLQRLRPKAGNPVVFEMKDVRALAQGIEVEFTEAVPLALLENAGSYFIQQWGYEPTDIYGGPKIGTSNLTISSILASADRKTVRLTLPEVEAGKVIYLRTGIRNDDGESLWSGESWYTMNQLPESDGTIPSGGWRDLFNGTDLSGWRAFKGTTLPPRWTVENGALTINPDLAGDVTDIVSEETFGDFELELEWKVNPDKNSGIFIRAQEQGNAIYEGGPEMQVVDDTLNEDGQNDLTRAGSIYNLYPLAPGAFNGANEWNQVRIIADGPNTKYFLNGTLVADFDVDSADYLARVAASNFDYITDFGQIPSGHIGFQDYNNYVQFRNIRIRDLDSIDDGGGDGPDIPPSTDTVRIELETGSTTSGASVSTEDPGFSGTGFVAGWDNYGSNETVTIPFNAGVAGVYQSRIQYGRARFSGVGELTEDGSVEVLVDGTLVGNFVLSTTPNWDEWQLSSPLNLTLDAGAHQITLRNPFASEAEKKNGVGNFDFIEITPPTPVVTLPDLSGFTFGAAGMATDAPFAATLIDGQIQARLTTETGIRYRLQTSNNLRDWSTMFTVMGDDSVQEVTAPANSPAQGAVFLRIVAE